MSKNARKGNSLLGAIDGFLDEEEDAAAKPLPPATAKPKTVKAEPANEPAKRGRPKAKSGPTSLVGGHFPTSVLKQLKIIAAEEGTTNQALLEEALNLLFVKKGKKKIENL